MSNGPKDDIFETKIKALDSQIMDLCREHGIARVSFYELDRQPDSSVDYVGSGCAVNDESSVGAKMVYRLVAQLVDAHPAAPTASN